MSKRILFFILFSWLASAAFPAFAQQKTDTVYTFRFVPRKDMFYPDFVTIKLSIL